MKADPHTTLKGYIRTPHTTLKGYIWTPHTTLKDAAQVTMGRRTSYHGMPHTSLKDAAHLAEGSRWDAARCDKGRERESPKYSFGR